MSTLHLPTPLSASEVQVNGILPLFCTSPNAALWVNQLLVESVDLLSCLRASSFHEIFIITHEIAGGQQYLFLTAVPCNDIIQGFPRLPHGFSPCLLRCDDGCIGGHYCTAIVQMAACQIHDFLHGFVLSFAFLRPNYNPCGKRYPVCFFESCICT